MAKQSRDKSPKTSRADDLSRSEPSTSEELPGRSLVARKAPKRKAEWSSRKVKTIKRPLIKRSYANGLVECYALAGASASEADLIDLRALAALQFGLFVPLQLAAEWPIWPIETAFSYLAAEVDASKSVGFITRYQRFMSAWVNPPLPPSEPESSGLDFKVIARNLRRYVQEHIDLWRVAIAVVCKSSDYRPWFELGSTLGEEVSRPVIGFREPLFPMALFPYGFGPRELGWRPTGFSEIADTQFKDAVDTCYSLPNEFPPIGEQVALPYVRYRLLHDVSNAGFSSVEDSFFIEEILQPPIDVEALEPTQCRAVRTDDSRPLRPVQKQILKELDGHALTVKALLAKIGTSKRRGLYDRRENGIVKRRGDLTDLKERGCIAEREDGRVFRPDAPPE